MISWSRATAGAAAHKRTVAKLIRTAAASASSRALFHEFNIAAFAAGRDRALTLALPRWAGTDRTIATKRQPHIIVKRCLVLRAAHETRSTNSTGAGVIAGKHSRHGGVVTRASGAAPTAC
jgi:hypothetical protein